MSVVLTLMRQLLRRSKGGLIALTIGLFVFEYIQPVAIDAFGNLDQLVSIMDLVPKPFLALMNVTPEVVEQVGLPGFLALGFTHPVYHLLMSAVVIWIAARGLAGEMESGQVQVSLARPVSRRQFYLARVLAVALIANGRIHLHVGAKPLVALWCGQRQVMGRHLDTGIVLMIL